VKSERLSKAGLIAIAFVAMMLFGVSALAQGSAADEGKFSAAGLKNREVEQFFLSFKEAVAKGDKGAVASMVSYPVKVPLASGQRVSIKNRAQFAKRYNAIFDNAFKRVISQTRVDDLWAKSSGVATPRGEIWLSGIIKNQKNPDIYEIKIIAINNVIDRTR
jgi:hypothetical protein